MKTIHGIEIQESKDLGYNLKYLRDQLSYKLSFWHHYNKGLRGIAKSMDVRKVNLFIRCLYFILLLPKYLVFQLSKSRIARELRRAEDELLEHYKLPETKVRQFRLECAEEKSFYQSEIDTIQSELDLLRDKVNAGRIGDKLGREIHQLVQAYEINLEAKQLKHNFYKSCEERLKHIEDQILLQRTLETSRQKLLSLQDDDSDSSRLTEIKKEFELYDYYGDLLQDISINLRKVSEDKHEQLREAELNAMLSKIKLEN